jgi:hypothetical protein
MRKMKFVGLLSLCMVPAMFWSSESQAVPSWSRKYAVSCYMCHSVMPGRNAVGEAFKNNGYRFPGAQEAAFTKQKNVQIGNDEWTKEFPNAPTTGSFPQFDPLSVVVQSNFFSYTGATKTVATGVDTNLSRTVISPFDNGVLFFYAGTLGDHISILGDVGSFASGVAATANNIRAIWTFSPGFNLAIGNAYSNQNWNGTGAGNVTNLSGVLPGPQDYVELNFTRGETGGYSIVAGTSTGSKGAALVFNQTIGTTSNTFNDLIYVRGKVKLFGAGLLSGANGELGNSYNGVDNQVTIGAGFTSAKKTGAPVGFTGNYAGETLVYGADIQGIHNDLMAGAAVSRDKDLGYTNYKVEVGGFVYPWLFAKVGYTDISVPGADRHKPTIVPTVLAAVGPNVTFQGTYTYNTKSELSNGTNIPNTFTLALRAGF